MCVFAFTLIPVISLCIALLLTLFLAPCLQSMPRKEVNILVTFVTASTGSKATPIVDNPIDVFKATNYIRDYTDVLPAVRDLVETKEYNLFSHNDVFHDYAFDGTSLHNGAIYGRREGRKEWEDIGARVTSSKLTPIQSNDAIKLVADETGEVVYRQ